MANPFELIAKEQIERAPSAPVQLAFWADARRGAPNAILRAAMFSAGKPTRERPIFKKRSVEALGPYAITHTGPQLYQPELDVWLELVHRCRLRPLGTEAEFHVGSFLKSLKRSTGKSDYTALLKTFELLMETTIEVSMRDEQRRRRGYIGHLVDSLAHDEATGYWRVSLNPKIAALFAPAEHTWLHVSARLALGRGYLAKWLHGYYSSHERPHPISVQRLRDLSGSVNRDIRDFRRKVKEALTEIARVEMSEGRRFEWRTDEGDLVHVSRDG